MKENNTFKWNSIATGKTNFANILTKEIIKQQIQIIQALFLKKYIDNCQLLFIYFSYVSLNIIHNLKWFVKNMIYLELK